MKLNRTFIILAVLCLVCSCAAFIFSKPPAAILVSGILITTLFLYYYIHKYIITCFNKEGPESFAQNFRNRNMDALILGSAKARYLYRPIENKTIMNLTCYRRSLFSDFNILKSFFSHLKEKGAVFICIDSIEAIQLEGQINPLDYKYYHKHLMMALDIQEPGQKSNNPLMNDPDFSFGYLRNELKRRLPKGVPLSWYFPMKSGNTIEEESIKKLAAQIQSMHEFCTEREIIPHIVFLESTRAYQKLNKRLIDTLGPKIVCCTVRTVEELNEVIRAKA